MRGRHVILLLALMGLPAVFFRSPSRQQELRVLITARNMVESGDWLHPVFQNKPRYRKPPVAYWLAAAGFKLSGHPQSAWAGRLPFYLCALGGIALFIRMAGPQAGLLLGSTLGFWMYAPLAETDSAQLTGILLAFYGWHRRSGTLSGIGMAFAALSKGPGGVAVPLITMALLAKKYPRKLRFWFISLIVPLITVGAWVVFLQIDPVAKEALARELSATFVNTEHSNPWFYYFYTLPLVMLPPLLLMFRKPATGNQKPAIRIPVIWLTVTLLLLTLVVSKQRHYALMLMPPAAWILALRYLPSVSLSLRMLAPCFLVIGLLELPIAHFTDDGAHTRFLQGVSEDLSDAGTIHVTGINSAVFDFHLGRHVENTDSATAALNRAQSGDTIVVIQKSKTFDAEAHPLAPLRTADHPNWIRRFYVKP